MDERELAIFEIISNGGNAKALVYDAIKASQAGDFQQAQALLEEADQSLTLAHNTQTRLIQEEIRGEGQAMSLLMVHAQDHLMTTIEVRSLAENLIAMNQKIAQLESKLGE